ncbi:hypothetical protein G6F35_015195 [Rhizopus arrhizus]|nr:hypothetical protein G6F35_015195 [Rhizopus arrhizus]
MRLVTFRAHPTAAARLGALAEGYVVDLALLGRAGGVDLPDDMLAFIDLGPVAVAQASRLMESYRGNWPVGTALPQENPHAGHLGRPAQAAGDLFQAAHHRHRTGRRHRT